MPSDGGFERRLVKQLNSNKENSYKYHAYRRKESRFSSQDIDVLIDSDKDQYYAGVECKSKKIDDSKDATSEAKLYFSQSFNENKDGKHQIPRITEFLKKTGRHGYLAIAYRRGRGKKVLEYALDWMYVQKLYEQDKSGIPKELVEKYGTRIDQDPTQIFENTITSTVEK